MKANRYLIAVLLLASLVLALGGQVALADPNPRATPAATRTPPAATPHPLVRFTGVVNSRPEGTDIGIWVIDGKSVKVTENTRIEEQFGPAEVGARVTVIATRVPVTTQDEVALEAVLIRVLPPPPTAQPITIRGRVNELGVDYLVVNRIHIGYDRSTCIEGRLEVDVFVVVLAEVRSAGFHALSINVVPNNSHVVEFEGVIESISESLWVVGGRRVRLNQCTLIFGQPAVGKIAKVRVLVAPQAVDAEPLALMIAVRNTQPETVEWTGIIEWLPPRSSASSGHYEGRWIVGGRAVLVTRETEIVGTPRIGRRAHVVAVRYPPSRLLVARKIEVLNVVPSATPATPTPTALP